MTREYTARRMKKSEFKTTGDMTRRDAAGALCGFAVEHDSGATVTGLSWQQACQIAEERNNQLEAA